jgi:hypothetical protein
VTTEPEQKQAHEARAPELKPMGRFPTKGRQVAAESFTSASLCARQTPEQFGGISTD